MPSSRLQPPPQTSKQARKAYLKSTKHFEYTATQKRVSERRLELDKRAKALQAKEQRKQGNKRKREEKEAAERDAKRKRIESGKAPQETLWGKVRASQPRLNAFFAQPKVADEEADDQSESEGEAISNDSYHPEDERGDNPADQAPEGAATETKGLESFFSSASSVKSINMAPALDSNVGEVPARPKIEKAEVDAYNTWDGAPSQIEDPDQALLDAQLSLSQGIFDFDIAEDDDAEWIPQEVEPIAQLDITQNHNHKNHLLATPSKRKAESADLEFTSPAKSARSALSEMSPSKVNIRAQEKPDISSVASLSSKLPTPSPTKQASSQGATEVLAMIATQDLEDDEFATDKENEDPCREELKTELLKKDFDQKTVAPTKDSLKLDPSRDLQPANKPSTQYPSFDEDIFDNDDFGAFESGLEDEQDDFDNDLDDEALAALAVHSPFKQRSPIFVGRISAMTATVTKPLAFEDAPSTLRSMPPPQATSMKPTIPAHTTQPRRGVPAATQGNSFAFDDVQDDDLTCFAEAFDIENVSSVRPVRSNSKKSRTIPWNNPSQFPRLQSSDKPLTQEDHQYDQ